MSCSALFFTVMADKRVGWVLISYMEVFIGRKIPKYGSLFLRGGTAHHKKRMSREVSRLDCICIISGLWYSGWRPDTKKDCCVLCWSGPRRIAFLCDMARDGELRPRRCYR